MTGFRRWAGWVATIGITSLYLGMVTGWVPMLWFFGLSLVNSALMVFHTWPIASRQMNLLAAYFVLMNLIGLWRLL